MRQQSSNNEADAKHLARLKLYSEETGKLISYAIQRIDLLIISVSGASIYVCLEIIKYIGEKGLPQNGWAFKTVGLAFVIAIVINFLGQWAAYLSSYHMKCSTDCEIEWQEYHQREVLKKPVALEKHDKQSVRYGRWVAWANIGSTGAMLIGLLALIISIWFTF